LVKTGVNAREKLYVLHSHLDRTRVTYPLHGMPE
jgi:hypothetical protein